MKNSILTVLGPISADEVGFCQCHEHLMLSLGKSFEVDPCLFFDDIEKSTAEVMRFRQKGGNTVVEAQPVGCNRVAEALVEISEKTGVNIIASTGFHKNIFYRDGHWIFEKSENELTDIFISELTEGMYIGCDTVFSQRKCSAKSGIIKTALDSCNFSGSYKKLFNAAAKAAGETGAPIWVHIEKGSDPELLADFFEKAGIEPGRLVFCHMDRTGHDISVQKSVLSRGIFLEFDTIGRFKYHSDEEEIDMFKKLLDSGYEDRLLFSLDTTGKRLKTYTPSGIGLDYIIDTFIPKMRLAGISEEEIDKISKLNPIKALTWK